MSRDTLGDFLTIIRNGTMVAKPFVLAPLSRERRAVADLLKAEGFVRDVIEVEGHLLPVRLLKVFLKYADGESVIHEIKRVSKPGRRVYIDSKSVKPVIGGLGLSILSTDKGVISHKQAREFGVGGEVLCTVW